MAEHFVHVFLTAVLVEIDAGHGPGVEAHNEWLAAICKSLDEVA